MRREKKVFIVTKTRPSFDTFVKFGLTLLEAMKFKEKLGRRNDKSLLMLISFLNCSMRKLYSVEMKKRMLTQDTNSPISQEFIHFGSSELEATVPPGLLLLL